LDAPTSFAVSSVQRNKLTVNYQAIGRKVLAKAKQGIEEGSPQFKKHSDDKGVKVYEQEMTKGTRRRATTAIKVAAQDVFNYIKDLDELCANDASFDTAELVSRPAADMNIHRIFWQSSGMFGGPARDAVILRVTEEAEDGTFSCVASSMVHPGAPQEDKLARIELQEFSFLIRPKGSKKCVVDYFLSAIDSSSSGSGMGSFLSGNDPFGPESMRMTLATIRDALCSD